MGVQSLCLRLVLTVRCAPMVSTTVSRVRVLFSWSREVPRMGCRSLAQEGTRNSSPRTAPSSNDLPWPMDLGALGCPTLGLPPRRSPLGSWVTLPRWSSSLGIPELRVGVDGRPADGCFEGRATIGPVRQARRMCAASWERRQIRSPHSPNPPQRQHGGADARARGAQASLAA